MLLAGSHLQQLRAASGKAAVFKKFNRVLIANRGEIALRVMRTARKMGIETVAVYSEADRKALHARTADYAHCIGPAAAAQSYLCMDKVLDTAIKSGAQAIHPGYGFLSENAIFANKCAEAGIVFIGPPAQAITDMGAKDISKRIMQQAKVPVVEGFHGEDQSDANLKVHAEKIGYPVMLKAVFGGGGKGMRIAFTPADFVEALSSARSEARKSFGRDEMLVEKFVERPRHVEVQVFGDSHGNYVHLWERDCSVQRRHQKIIEEAPAPNIDHATRLRLGESAVKAAAAVNYVGAGTVEFIMDPRNDFYFMEMNTRLQVEHPVSELITGTDLVEWQLRVAQGEKLPLKQEEIPLIGHAFECRVYAEDTVEGAFMPSAGKMEYASFPTEIARVDTGVESGDEVSVHYDPMIAKVIVHGRDRASASQALDAALAKTTIVGLPTNISFVRRILAHPEFAAGNVYTEFIPDHSAELFKEIPVTKAELIEGALAQTLSSRVSTDKLYSQLIPFRVNHQPVVTKKCGKKSVDLVQKDENTWEAEIDGEKTTVLVSELRRSSCGHELHFRVEAEGEAWRTKAVETESGTLVVVGKGEQTYEPEAKEWGDAGAGGAATGGHAIAPMPGIVERILVQKGDVVKAGQALVVVVAMKMEYIIRATRDSIVDDVTCAPAQNVPRSAVLVKLTAQEQ